MKPFQYAIIGGTGVYDSGGSSFHKTVETEYGEVEVDIAEVKNNSIALSMFVTGSKPFFFFDLFFNLNLPLSLEKYNLLSFLGSEFKNL